MRKVKKAKGTLHISRGGLERVLLLVEGAPSLPPPSGRLKKGRCGGNLLRTSPAGSGERRLEEGHGSAVPFLTNGACTRCGRWFVAGEEPHYNRSVKRARMSAARAGRERWKIEKERR
jgi:hypothetical protein